MGLILKTAGLALWLLISTGSLQSQAVGVWGVDGWTDQTPRLGADDWIPVYEALGQPQIRERLSVQAPRSSGAVVKVAAAGFPVIALFHPGGSMQGTTRSTLNLDLGTVFQTAEKMAVRDQGTVSVWELLNEPEIFNRDMPDQVASFQKAVYLGLKAGDPNVRVIGPSLALNPTHPYWDWISRNRMWDYAEGYNFHYYGWISAWPASLEAHVGFAMRQSGHARKLEAGSWKLEAAQTPPGIKAPRHPGIEGTEAHCRSGLARESEFLASGSAAEPLLPPRCLDASVAQCLGACGALPASSFQLPAFQKFEPRLELFITEYGTLRPMRHDLDDPVERHNQAVHLVAGAAGVYAHAQRVQKLEAAQMPSGIEAPRHPGIEGIEAAEPPPEYRDGPHLVTQAPATQPLFHPLLSHSRAPEALGVLPASGSAAESLIPPRVAAFMPFVTQWSVDPGHDLLKDPRTPYPAWDQYVAFAREHPLAYAQSAPEAQGPRAPSQSTSGTPQPAFAAPAAPPLVLQWRPAPKSAFPHKDSGSYRFYGRRDMTLSPIQGVIRAWNFSQVPILTTVCLRQQGGPGIAAEFCGVPVSVGVEAKAWPLTVPPMGFADLPLVFTPPALTHYAWAEFYAQAVLEVPTAPGSMAPRHRGNQLPASAVAAVPPPKCEVRSVKGEVMEERDLEAPSLPASSFQLPASAVAAVPPPSAVLAFAIETQPGEMNLQRLSLTVSSAPVVRLRLEEIGPGLRRGPRRDRVGGGAPEFWPAPVWVANRFAPADERPGWPLRFGYLSPVPPRGEFPNGQTAWPSDVRGLIPAEALVAALPAFGAEAVGRPTLESRQAEVAPPPGVRLSPAFTTRRGDLDFFYKDYPFCYARTNRSGPWDGINGLEVRTVAAPELGDVAVELHTVYDDPHPQRHPLATCKVAGLPRGGFIRLVADADLWEPGVDVRVDLIDAWGRAWSIFDQSGRLRGVRGPEKWLRIADFHHWFHGNADPHAVFVPEAIREIQLTVMEPKPGARHRVGLSFWTVGQPE